MQHSLTRSLCDVSSLQSYRVATVHAAVAHSPCDVSSLQSYREALDSEDYSTAARLRDEGATGLPGWWVADNKDDPKGHLLRISTGFGRYVGYAYTPQDLAQAEVGACKTAPV